MDGRIAKRQTCVIRRIAPDEVAREAELVAVISPRRRQVLDVEDRRVPRDLECRIGHERASRHAPVCGLLHRCRKRWYQEGSKGGQPGSPMLLRRAFMVTAARFAGAPSAQGSYPDNKI